MMKKVDVIKSNGNPRTSAYVANSKTAFLVILQHSVSQIYHSIFIFPFTGRTGSVCSPRLVARSLIEPTIPSDRHNSRPSSSRPPQEEDDYYNCSFPRDGRNVAGPPDGSAGYVESDCAHTRMPAASTNRQSMYQRQNVTEPICCATPREADISTRSQTEPIVVKPQELHPWEVEGDFEIGSLVEVTRNPPECRYGVIKWLGYITDGSKPFVGLEMEEENPSCTNGTFGKYRLFVCAPKKAYFTYVSKIKKDGRFEESLQYTERRHSQCEFKVKLERTFQ